MREITFSVFDHGQQGFERLRSLLDQFERAEGVQVKLEKIGWPQGWSRLLEVALYHDGPDVSEVGSTWVSDLVMMDALRPFEPGEFEKIIDGKPFFPSVLPNLQVEYQGRIEYYAAPWSGDSRVVFYRRDLLQKAGIDEETAFTDAEQFDNTLSALQQNGVEMPLALPTTRSHMTIHNAASWIWGAGGSFLDPEKSQITFNHLPALSGLKAYFGLNRFLGGRTEIEESLDNELFWSGQAATDISGYWVLHTPDMIPLVRENLGVAPVLGVPFVGGNNLVIWKHSLEDRAAVRLVKFLISSQSAREIYPYFGLPISEQDWQFEPFNTPEYRAFLQAMSNGRPFPGGKLWGMVEKRLVDVFADIWQEIRTTEASVDEIVDRNINNLANRLELTLHSS
jgi:multiple sugar transport system substrate-binding protein